MACQRLPEAFGENSVLKLQCLSVTWLTERLHHTQQVSFLCQLTLTSVCHFDLQQWLDNFLQVFQHDYDSSFETLLFCLQVERLYSQVLVNKEQRTLDG